MTVNKTTNLELSKPQSGDNTVDIFDTTNDNMDLLDTKIVLNGLDASKPASPVVGQTYIATNTDKIYKCITAGAWTLIKNVDLSGNNAADLADITSTGANIEDAVTKKHTQNTDTDLDATFEATIAKHADKLSAFAATTSAELAGVISDETGTDKLVYNTSPTLVTPTLGAAAATSINLTGGQIAFPAAQAASADANTLDDYEEGTWTAVIRGSGTAGTYEITTQYSNYTKIGRVVHLESTILFAGTVTGGGTGYMQITGCPFTKMTGSAPIGVVGLDGIDFTGTQITVGFIARTITDILSFAEIVDAGAIVDFPISAIGANNTIGFSITFFI